MKNERRGGGSKSPIRSRGSKTGSGSGPSQTQPAGAAQNTIQQQTNDLGQIVYSISPSQFDISPPLSELAKLKIPRRPAEQLPELELPPSRILRSDQPDPVTQVVPSRGARFLELQRRAATGFNFAGIAGIADWRISAGYERFRRE